jgi:16S rRNA C967 or C1407 C5-methylase (RsmB/RsmF family)
MLKHVLKLPRLRRCVYSTCSTTLQENEGVINEILQDANVTNTFHLINVCALFCFHFILLTGNARMENTW